MKKFIKNYQKTIIMLVALIIGIIGGLVLKEKALVVKPLGDLFLNLLFISIVPLIFLNITTSIARIKSPKRLGKIIKSIALVFIFTSLISAFLSIIVTYKINLVDSSSGIKIRETLEDSNKEEIDLNILERTVDLISVNDFNKLFSKENIIALVVFSCLIGIAISRAKEKGDRVLQGLIELNEVVMQFINLIMYYAPIGISCYMATFIGTFGASIALGYLKTFIIYTLVCLVVYFVIYSLYAFIAQGKKGVRVLWQNILIPTMTALATCSSAACIPVNIKATKKMGISNDICDTTIPLGTSFHKDGSVIGSVFKIMFLVSLFEMNVHNFNGFIQVLVVALIANLLITAVPIGGGTISEMLIISMLNFPAGALPILTVIATIIDAPATVLNVTGDTVSSMLVSKIVDGKKWLSKQQN